MELGLNGKVAVVTGASRGLGAAIAVELAREGVHLCLAARDQAKLDEVAATATAGTQVRAVTIAADLRQPASVAATIGKTLEAFGRIDILVNNAGATKRDDFFKLTDDDWADGFALKFHGYVRMTRSAWPHLKAVRGSIINIVGVGARGGKAEFTIGGSVNSALLNFTKAMSEIGIADGVRVNAINPGRIETDRLTRNLDRLSRLHGTSVEDTAKHLLADCGIARFGRPDEIATLTAFLASSKADYIQGSLIDVDGGETRAL
jgi:NAD(P)-dependent dehydrogenase (short-subunit alcohol dehydrogenase family)